MADFNRLADVFDTLRRDPSESGFMELERLTEEFYLTEVYFKEGRDLHSIMLSPTFRILVDVGYVLLTRSIPDLTERSLLHEIYTDPSNFYKKVEEAYGGLSKSVGFISSTFRIHAAHFLPLYKGKCRRLHGHEWKIHVGLTTESFDSRGFVTDFSDFKKMVRTITDRLDHRLLNIYFPNPTAELIQATLYLSLSARVGKSKKIVFIRVCETENNCFEMTPAVDKPLEVVDVQV